MSSGWLLLVLVSLIPHVDSAASSLFDTYTTAKVTSVLGTNFPATGGVSVTVIGSSFGSSGNTAVATIAGRTCEATAWTSVSQLVCKANANLQNTVDIRVTVVGATNSSLAIGTTATYTTSTTNSTTNVTTTVTTTKSVYLSFDAPRVSSLTQIQVAASGSVSVTLVGRGLGHGTAASTLRIRSRTDSEASLWRSETAALCKKSLGRQFKSSIFAMSQQVAVGSFTVAFTYPATVSSALPRNAPDTGATSITVLGKSFGYHQSSAARVSGSACRGTTWIADTSMHCKLPTPQLAYTSLGIVASIPWAPANGTQLVIFSYDTNPGPEPVFVPSWNSTNSSMPRLVAQWPCDPASTASATSSITFSNASLSAADTILYTLDGASFNASLATRWNGTTPVSLGIGTTQVQAATQRIYGTETRLSDTVYISYTVDERVKDVTFSPNTGRWESGLNPTIPSCFFGPRISNETNPACTAYQNSSNTHSSVHVKTVSAALSTGTVGATVMYFINGTVVNGSVVREWKQYTAPIVIEKLGPTLIIAYAYKPGLHTSYFTCHTYHIIEKVIPPTFSPPGGAVSGPPSPSATFGNNVTIVMNASLGVSIYYTTDAHYPSKNTTLYTAPIVLSQPGVTVVQAVGYKDGAEKSELRMAVFNLVGAQKCQVLDCYEYLLEIRTGVCGFLGEVTGIMCGSCTRDAELWVRGDLDALTQHDAEHRASVICDHGGGKLKSDFIISGYCNWTAEARAHCWGQRCQRGYEVNECCADCIARYQSWCTGGDANTACTKSNCVADTCKQTWCSDPSDKSTCGEERCPCYSAANTLHPGLTVAFSIIVLAIVSYLG